MLYQQVSSALSITIINIEVKKKKKKRSRVLSVPKSHVGTTMFTANFNLVTRVRLTQILE